MKITVRNVILGLIVILAVISVFYNYRLAKKVTVNTEEQERLSLIKAVSKLMELPSEVPTVATVTDIKKLEGQSFFKGAVNGDKVLLYPTALKAILYRPSTKKIIEVGPFSVSENQNLTESPTPTLSDKLVIKVVIYNGTKLAGYTKGIEDKVKEIEGLEITDRMAATKRDYRQTLVVDLSNKYADIAGGIAQILDGKTGDLPEGEVRPEADILIIAGK